MSEKSASNKLLILYVYVIVEFNRNQSMNNNRNINLFPIYYLRYVLSITVHNTIHIRNYCLLTKLKITTNPLLEINSEFNHNKVVVSSENIFSTY